MKHCCYYSKSGRHDRGNWFLDYYLCAVDGAVMSRDCEEVACAIRKTVAKVLYMYTVGQAQIIIMLRYM